MKNNKQNFIVTTANGTRWGATGTSAANVRENFWTISPIVNVEAGSLFTHEESEQLRKEKIIESVR